MKKVLVCGVARSGIAAAKLLKEQGYDVTLQDIKPEVSLPDDLDVQLILGRNPDDVISQQDLIVISPGIPFDLPFLEKARSLGIRVIGEIELAYDNCPCPIIAITGTNGKTTTTSLTGEIMSLYNKGTAVVGNIGLAFCERVGSLSANDYVVAEVSSFQLETIERFKPRVSALLNVTPDHLNRHKTLENYANTKAKIFANQTEDDISVLNYDDRFCRSVAGSCKRVIFFSRKEILEDGVYIKDGWVFVKDSAVLPVTEINLLGEHNLENVLAAVAVTYSAGVPLGLIRQAVKNFQSLEHRLEFVTEHKGVKYYNDSKGTNPDCAIKSIQTFTRPIVLIGGGYDKGSDFSDWVKAFEGRVKHLVVLGEVADKIIDVCKAYGFNSYDKVNSLREAVLLAESKANSGDVVLLSPACASWDMFEDFEQRGRLFKSFVYDLKSEV